MFKFWIINFKGNLFIEQETRIFQFQCGKLLSILFDSTQDKCRNRKKAAFRKLGVSTTQLNV